MGRSRHWRRRAGPPGGTALTALNPGRPPALTVAPGIGHAPVRIEKPWGYELIFAETDDYAGKLLHIAAGHRLSRQFHRMKDETILVQSGTLAVELGEGDNLRAIRLAPCESLHIPAGAIHRFIAISTVELVEVSTPHLDDVVRLEDDYGREGTSSA